MKISTMKFEMILILCCVSSINSEQSEQLSPLIFVPGLGGNQLQAKLNKTSRVNFLCHKHTNRYRIWLDSAQLLPILINCWVDNMRLSYDNTTRTTRNAPGVTITVPGFGKLSAVEVIDPTPFIQQFDSGFYYHYIIKALMANGYNRQKNLFGAPYDFRKGPNENIDWFAKVQRLAEIAYERNDNTRVTFIAHSMGGLMVLQFLQRMTVEWKQTFIKQTITLSTPWGGSVQSLQALISGYDFGSAILDNSVMKRVQETCPSLVWLLPSQNFWQPDEILVQTREKKYTMDKIDDIFNDINNPYVKDIQKDLLPFSNLSAPGVEAHCLYGKNLRDTPERLLFNNGLNSPDPIVIYGDGDGTVNIRSLVGCTYWENTTAQSNYTVYHQAFPNAEHLDLLGDNRIINYIIHRLIPTERGPVRWDLESQPIGKSLRFF